MQYLQIESSKADHERVAALRKINIESNSQLSELWQIVSRIRFTTLAAWNLYQLMDIQHPDHSEVLLNLYRTNIYAKFRAIDQKVIPDDLLLIRNCMYENNSTMDLVLQILNVSQKIKRGFSVSKFDSYNAVNILFRKRIGEIVHNCLGPLNHEQILNDAFKVFSIFKIDCVELRQQIDLKAEGFFRRWEIRQIKNKNELLVANKNKVVH